MEEAKSSGYSVALTDADAAIVAKICRHLGSLRLWFFSTISDT
jgi:hypothetical protein